MRRDGKGVSEFDLIRRLQEIICIKPSVSRPGPVVGIGDDGAVLALPANSQLVVSTDTLVENVHFLCESSATDLGHKALAVNLSDLAAMGAEPAWFFLALTLPEIQPDWLEDFAQGMAGLAEDAGIQLAGGDVTSGPLSITITVLGLVESGQALRRTGARAGDLIVVSGTLGDAALALQAIAAGGSPDTVSGVALNRPIPRLELGLQLRGLASSCIDVSDGLLADLGHILLASGKGAEIGDFWLSETRSQPEVLKALTKSLPPGLTINNINEIPQLHGQKLPGLVDRSEYLVTLSGNHPGLDDKITTLLQSTRSIRSRKGKEYDLRPLIHDISLQHIEGDAQPSLEISLFILPSGTGRPDEVLLALDIPPYEAIICRSALVLKQIEES